MTAVAAAIAPATPVRVLAAQLRHQLAEDFARSPTGPSAAPTDYLGRCLELVDALTLSLCDLACEENWVDGELGQNRRQCAVVDRLLRAAADAVHDPVPSRAAWETARRFLTAADATLGDLLGDCPVPTSARLHLVAGGRGSKGQP